MLNFFKTKETAAEVVSKYPKEVLEIHHEFETAADKLLDEANIIIKEAASKDVVKVSRLESLGFKQAAQVTEIKPLLEKAALSKEQVDLINYYKHNYPFNKFITEDQVQTICHKYNLVCGPVNRFKGFVPEKNLQQIENFKLKQDDVLPEIVVFIDKTGKIEKLDWSKVIDLANVNYLIDTYLKSNDFSFIDDYSTYPKYTRIINRNLYNRNGFKIQEELQIGLQICAPIKDMDITGLELTEGYKLTKIHVPDPVVLQPVSGGYLILTAWGDEASDPLVINEINN